MGPMEALRFACQPGCTRCCDQQGFVYLTEDDLQRAAQFLGLTPQQFERQYVYRTKYLLRLRKPRGRQCPFLVDHGCSIHPAKPTQCRLFPFWPEIVESRRAWSRTARLCPGIGQGPLIHIGTALETASEMKHCYPVLYGIGPATRRRS
jgi:Fe-S-cluster containining protein